MRWGRLVSEFMWDIGECGCEQYKNQSEDEKQNLIKYRKRYYEMQKDNSKVVQKDFSF